MRGGELQSKFHKVVIYSVMVGCAILVVPPSLDACQSTEGPCCPAGCGPCCGDMPIPFFPIPPGPTEAGCCGMDSPVDRDLSAALNWSARTSAPRGVVVADMSVASTESVTKPQVSTVTLPSSRAAPGSPQLFILHSAFLA
jgi:hypothetical protein